MLDRIVESVRRTEPATIIEIGPGQGVLTEQLLATGARVHAIELDPNMIDKLVKRFPNAPNLTLHHTDVLDTNLTQWGPAALAGNLPYYITSPILDRIFQARSVIHSATLLIQKEVADRLVAKPGSRDYAYLTVVTQSWAEPELICPVPPDAFRPPPKVDSAVVHLALNADPPKDTPAFLKFAAQCFRQKRKTLRNNLQGNFPNADWANLPERGLRAEQLSIADLRALWGKLS